jgi:hypothetical protein
VVPRGRILCKGCCEEVVREEILLWWCKTITRTAIPNEHGGGRVQGLNVMSTTEYQMATQMGVFPFLQHWSFITMTMVLYCMYDCHYHLVLYAQVLLWHCLYAKLWYYCFSEVLWGPLH